MSRDWVCCAAGSRNQATAQGHNDYSFKQGLDLSLAMPLRLPLLVVQPIIHFNTVNFYTQWLGRPSNNQRRDYTNAIVHIKHFWNATWNYVPSNGPLYKNTKRFFASTSAISRRGRLLHYVRDPSGVRRTYCRKGIQDSKGENGIHGATQRVQIRQPECQESCHSRSNVSYVASVK